MKEERLVAALDARLPDAAARARMWAAVEAAWEAEAGEGAAAGTGESACVDGAEGESETSTQYTNRVPVRGELRTSESESAGQETAFVGRTSADATCDASAESTAPSAVAAVADVIDATLGDAQKYADCVSSDTAENASADAVASAGAASDNASAFTVTSGGQAAKRRARRYSWRAPAVAAVLVVAIGTGIIFAANGGLSALFGGEETISDNPTPGSSGTIDSPGSAADAALIVEWNGAQYALVSDAPLAADAVGERLGEGTVVRAADGEPVAAGSSVEVFAAAGRYATGSYLAVLIDGDCLLFIALS